MERRRALATAASVSAVALAATLAFGANVGLFGLSSSDNGPGSFELVNSKTSEPIVRTEIVDVPITAPDSASSRTAPTAGSTSPSVSSDETHSTPTVASTSRSDNDDDSHAPEDEHEDEPDEHEDEEDD